MAKKKNSEDSYSADNYSAPRVTWNANADALHDHERHAFETGESEKCHAGAIVIDDNGHVWLHATDGRNRLIGYVE